MVLWRPRVRRRRLLHPPAGLAQGSSPDGRSGQQRGHRQADGRHSQGPGHPSPLLRALRLAGQAADLLHHQVRNLRGKKMDLTENINHYSPSTVSTISRTLFYSSFSSYLPS